MLLLLVYMPLLIFFNYTTFIFLFCLYIVHIQAIIHGKNDFAKISKILLDTDFKIILLDYQNILLEP